MALANTVVRVLPGKQALIRHPKGGPSRLVVGGVGTFANSSDYGDGRPVLNTNDSIVVSAAKAAALIASGDCTAA